MRRRRGRRSLKGVGTTLENTHRGSPPQTMEGKEYGARTEEIRA